MVTGALLGYVPISFATGVLGTPVDGSTVSGVGVISGYHCTSKDIDIYIDGVWVSKAGAGTTLLGTQGVCGRTDTGFSFLYAFNNLSNGQHTVSVAADGVVFDQNTVTTFRSGGVPWLSGASKSIKVPDFPNAGEMATLEWVQSYQNFLITNIESTANDLSGLSGNYAQPIYVTNYGSSCGPYSSTSGARSTNITVSTAAPAGSKDSLMVFGYASNDICLFALNRTSGNSASGYFMSGQSVCASSAYVYPVAVSGLKLAPDHQRLNGILTVYYPGCQQQIELL
jgi:hypothetical protein